MAYFGRSYQVPVRAPVYNISGNVNRNYYNQSAIRGGYTNQAFAGAQQASYPIYNKQQPVAPSTTRVWPSRLMCAIFSLLCILLCLVIMGIVIPVVFNMSTTDSGTVSQATQPPLPTIAPQPQPTQAPQPQPTQAPQPQPTQAPQPQPTQAPQPQPTQAPQPQITQAPQPQTTQAPPQPTQAPQPQPTEAPQPQTTSAPQQPTDPPVVIEGDIFNTGICGRQPVLDNRIVGGSNSNLGTWPWIGALLNNNEQGCGATLLNSRWAVTAAHCIVDPGFTPPDTIVFGFTDLTNYGSFSQQSGFLRMITHPSYDSDDPAAEYDITLLHLSQTIQFTNYVLPVCLATLEQETSVYSNCYAAGWGALVESRASSSDISSIAAMYPDILQEVSLPLISSADCRAIDDRVTSNIICGAGTSQGGIDTCQGDSGGPFVCESTQDDFWHLVGVVSTGEGCARPNTPGFYTRVSQFISWIETTVAQYS